MKTLIVYLCLASALLLATEDATIKVEDFAPKGGHFTIQMPGQPKEQTKKVDTEVGPVDAHMFVYGPHPNTAYMVSYSDCPEEMVKNSDSQKVLDGGRDAAVKGLHGKLASEKTITIDHHPGRDLVISTARFQLRDRIYLVDARLYQVMVVGSKDFITGKDAEKFLDSFKLSKE